MRSATALADEAHAGVIRLPVESQPDAQRRSDNQVAAHFSYARALSGDVRTGDSAASEDRRGAEHEVTVSESRYTIAYTEIPAEATGRKRLIAGAATLALATVGGLLVYDRMVGLTPVFAALPQLPAAIQEQPVSVRTDFSEFSLRISDRLDSAQSGDDSRNTIAHLR